MNLIEQNFLFKFDELIEFSEISGDWNPIHHDQEISRRYSTEKPIVHGIYTLIKVLDIFLINKKFCLEELKCNFIMPIFPNYSYKLYAENKSDENVNLYLFKGEKLAFNCNLSFISGQINSSRKKYFPEPGFKKEPQNPLFDDLKNVKGVIEIQANLIALEHKIPNLFKSISSDSIASLITTSRLVGMICPGLNSLFSSLSIKFTNNFEKNNFNWQVNSISKKFLPININFESSGLTGSIKAFYRDSPIKQKSIKELRTIINKKSYLPQNILVIGGTRGIGELVTKLLILREANITFTFAKGKKDAIRVSEEIKNYNHKANFYNLDILDSSQLKNFLISSQKFDQIYIFASPRIKESQKYFFDNELYEKYNSYYVKPILDIAETLKLSNNSLTRIFYPSTIFLDKENHKSFLEYKASKYLGEIICKDITEKNSKIEIISSRLPMILTDQTSKVNKSIINDGIKVLEKILDLMYG